MDDMTEEEYDRITDFLEWFRETWVPRLERCNSNELWMLKDSLELKEHHLKEKVIEESRKEKGKK